jgi:hypothetical protein
MAGLPGESVNCEGTAHRFADGSREAKALNGKIDEAEYQRVFAGVRARQTGFPPCAAKRRSFHQSRQSVCELSIDMFFLSLLHGPTRSPKIDPAAGRSTESKKLAHRLADQSTLIRLLRAFSNFTGIDPRM